MPTPAADETKSDFLDRCPDIVIDDGTTDDHVQAVAICNDMWDDRERMVNPLEFIKRLCVDFGEAILAGVETIIGTKRAPPLNPKERALAMSRVFERARIAIDAANPMEWVFIHDIFQDGDTWFAIASSGGNLWQYPLTVTEADVVAGERVQVIESFTPVQQTTVTRQTDGSYRWLSVSATALINKVGEIDSTELFDDFERQSLEDGYEWPYRCFYHLGEQFRTGQVDFIARHGFALITSGIYDDTVLGQTEAKARLADPDAWRDSIHFQPSAAPDVIEVNEIKIPVHRAGGLVEVTTAPADGVCSYGTTQTIMEVTRMEKGSRVHDAFLKLFSGDEDAANKWLGENPGAATRAVADGAVARDDTPPEDPPAQEPPPVEREVVVDDELVGIIADQVLVKLGEDDGPLAQIATTLEELARKMEGASTEAERVVRETEERFAALELTDEKRTDIIRQDMPRRELIMPKYRPRIAHDKKKDNGTPDLAAQAEDTLSRLPLR